MSQHQPELPLIDHQVENRVVHQRAVDGYINATAMCRAAGKRFHDYSRLGTTQQFLEALTVETGIPVSMLVQQFKGRPAELQGSWVNPLVATHLAQWLSPQFAVRVAKWVYEWMSGRAASQDVPVHIRRYTMNQHKIPPTHFSMLNQMTFRLQLLAPSETQGYILPERLMLDISLGKIFSNQLRDRGHDPDSFPKYPHEFPDGRIVYARLYLTTVATSVGHRLTRLHPVGIAATAPETRDLAIRPHPRLEPPRSRFLIGEHLS